MQSIPFLFSNLPIWVHRAWQVFLNVSVVLVFILSLQKRLNIKNRLIQLIFLTFNYLWLSQIYIYYHLIIIALVIIAFYSNGNWKRNLPIIFFSSVWAGFSRINWIPVPGLLAAFLYFLETKYDSRKKILTYIHQPLLYSLIGIVTGLIAQIIYIFISGNNSIRTHTAIFRSSLLWYRLFPNSTFVLGILPGILIISGFIIFFVIRYFFLQGEVAWNRKLFIAIILITFFVGGLVVSVKIGGGNNLHNMDAFIVFLLVLACYVYFDNINVDNVINYQRKLKFPRFILIGIVVTPILWSLFFTSQPSVTKMNESGAEEVIRKMNRVIETYSPNRKILFISQRQLVTFNYLKNIEMVPDFEQELLMEMVMSHDKERLDKFYEQLINHTYEIIITYPLNTKLVGYESSFSEENNLWVNGVSRRIYNRYQTIALFPDYGIEMLIPK